MDKKDIVKNLQKLDKSLSQTVSSPVSIYIAGGSAFALLGCDNRTTRDIDVLKHTAMEVRGITQMFKESFVNCDVAAYFDNFPVGFASRASKVDIGTSSLNVFVLSKEDLVVSKLCTTRFEQDVEDVENPLIYENLDWTLLDKLADSMKYSMISSLAYDNFKFNYDSYCDKYREMGRDYDDV